MTTNRIGRIIRTLIALQSNHNNRSSDLAEMNQCCKRTIYRDLEELKKVGIDYQYDYKNNRYQLDPESTFDPPGLNSKEAIALLLLVYKARNHLRIPFKNSALMAALKLESSLAPPIRKYCKDILANISVKPAPQEITDSFDSVFLLLMNSIYKKRIVHFLYGLSGNIKSEITLDPYHLYHRNHKWYLVGRSHFHKKTMHFELNRLKKFKISDKCFVVEGDFDINEYVNNSWYTESDHGLYNVKLRFSAQAAQEAAAIQWYDTQFITHNSDGSIIIGFIAHSLDETVRWVLSYGDNIRVISPEVLRKKVVKTANSILNLYTTK
jgi:predicted DNA-binding transcriptional regulator YafY